MSYSPRRPRTHQISPTLRQYFTHFGHWDVKSQDLSEMLHHFTASEKKVRSQTRGKSVSDCSVRCWVRCWWDIEWSLGSNSELLSEVLNWLLKISLFGLVVYDSFLCVYMFCFLCTCFVSDISEMLSEILLQQLTFGPLKSGWDFIWSHSIPHSSTSRTCKIQLFLPSEMLELRCW